MGKMEAPGNGLLDHESRGNGRNLRSFDEQTNHFCQYRRKCIETAMENIDTDLRVERVNENLALCIENILRVADSYFNPLLLFA